jgi:uncharacterized protein YqcC (DUF446 family)
MFNHQIAARALEDYRFAQKLMTGEEDYPEVRDAILADLFEADQQAAEIGVEGPKFATRFVDAGPRFGPMSMGPCYVKYYPKMVAADAWQQWVELPRLNLTRLAKERLSPVAAARHALEDHTFAQKIMTGEEDYPEVRDAILADLFEADEQAVETGAREPGFATRFIDAGPRFGPMSMGPCYVKYYPKMVAATAWQQWVELPRLNLRQMVETDRG